MAEKLNNRCTLMQGDCLDLLKATPDQSVDLVLADLPYGMLKGFDVSKMWGTKKYVQVQHNLDWDAALPIKVLYNHYARILRPNGVLVLTSMGDFTDQLRSQNHDNLKIVSRAIWLKNNFSNPFMSHKTLSNIFEDLTVWRKKYDTDYQSPGRKYAKLIVDYILANYPGVKTKRDIQAPLGKRSLDHFLRYDSVKFGYPTRTTYQKLTTEYGLVNMPGFLSYDQLMQLKATAQATFNLPSGKKSRTTVFHYPIERKRYHYTQKPVELLRELIRIYTNPGDMVLDNTMGSGSTGVAAMLEHRSFTGIELDEHYYDVSVERITEAIGDDDDVKIELLR